MQIDRRAWLRSVGIAAGGIGVARFVGASPASPAAATAPGAASGSASGPGAAPLARLSLNENPYGPSPAVVTAIQHEFSRLCRYTGEEYDTLVGLIAAKE